MRTARLLLALPLALIAGGGAAAQPRRSMTERYARAEQMLPWNTTRVVFGDQVQSQPNRTSSGGAGTTSCSTSSA